jgi:Uma2 family endonuclease
LTNQREEIHDDLHFIESPSQVATDHGRPVMSVAVPTTAVAFDPPSPAKPPGDALTDLLSAQLPFLPTGETYRIGGVSWDAYQRLLVERDNHRRGANVTFDRGALLLMTTTSVHERWKKTLAMMIEACALEMNILFEPTGNLTVAREDLESGAEPDESYYFQNAGRIPLDRPIDFATDVPPDLGVEIEYTRPVAARLPVFAALGIPELWVYDGERLRVLLLANNAYEESPASRCLPAFPLDLVGELLPRVTDTMTSAIIREFRSRLPKG